MRHKHPHNGSCYNKRFYGTVTSFTVHRPLVAGKDVIFQAYVYSCLVFVLKVTAHTDLTFQLPNVWPSSSSSSLRFPHWSLPNMAHLPWSLTCCPLSGVCHHFPSVGSYIPLACLACLSGIHLPCVIVNLVVQSLQYL